MEYQIGRFIAVQTDKDGGVWVTKPSMLSNQIHTLHIPDVDALTVATWLLNRENGNRHSMVQDAFPQVSNDLREFLLTGITPTEWTATFGEEE